tara:strand:+ start:430 stop:645 length:216 start_codon:yes stop_codon:yes gene_type:complete
LLLAEEDSKQWLTKQNTIERRIKTMQIKITPMKNIKTPKAESKRDHWRSHNKAKTTRRKVAQFAKRLSQAS